MLEFRLPCLVTRERSKSVHYSNLNVDLNYPASFATIKKYMVTL